ncbi:MAG: type IV secretion system protein [Burkholderiales bacterium]|nr:type IV secretion system protein [Burkholderiales bacterium]
MNPAFLHDYESDRRRIRSFVFAFGATYGMLYWMSGAHAQGMDAILGVVEQQGKGIMSTLAQGARTTFIALATIEITWCAALWAFEKDNMSSMMGDMVKTIMTLCFFYALMVNAPEWIGIIHEQFKSVSANSLKVTALTPDGVIAEGVRASIFVQINMLNPLNLWAGLASQIATLISQVIAMMALVGTNAEAVMTTLVSIGATVLWGFTGFMIGGLVSLCVLICYLIIALQLVMLQVEMCLLMAAGAVFLGLGGSRWTRDYVQKYMNHALVTGLRYLVLMMVLSFTLAGVDQDPWAATTGAWTGAMSNAMSVGSTGTASEHGAQLSAAMSSLGILFLVLTKTFLAIKAPELASALMTGGAALTANSVADTVMTGVNAAATVVGAPGTIAQSAEAMGMKNPFTGAGKEAAGGHSATSAVPNCMGTSTK